MVVDANVTNVNLAAEAMDGQTATPAAAESAAPEPSPTRPRAWAMPGAPVSRQQVEAFGRTVAMALVKAASAIAKAVAAIARCTAHIVARISRAAAAVPAALQVLTVMALLMLLGIVGSIAATGTLALICAIVVVPLCSIALGALGQRWLSRNTGDQAPQAQRRSAEALTSDLSRSVGYVDKKLTLALNSLGSDRHQQAVIALFQAKTAVELALGTDLDDPDRVEAPVQVDAYRLRPRIQAGPTSKSAMPESSSLAAS